MNLLFWVLFLASYLERVVFDLGPNIELVTLAMLLSASYLGTEKSLKLVLLILILSDMVIGNTNIFIFTWSGFLIPALLAGKIFMKARFSGSKRVLLGSGLGIMANLFFFIWTNFGVWALDNWGMYTNDLGGLIACYINGLPFLKAQLVSTLLFVPIGFSLHEYVMNLQFTKYKVQFERG